MSLYHNVSKLSKILQNNNNSPLIILVRELYLEIDKTIFNGILLNVTGIVNIAKKYEIIYLPAWCFKAIKLYFFYARQKEANWPLFFGTHIFNVMKLNWKKSFR